MKKNDINYTPRKTIYAGEKAESMYDLDEIIQYLKNGFPIRTIKEELEREIERRSDEAQITREEVVEILRVKCGRININNWLSAKGDKMMALTKDSALKIAFALQMGYKEASNFFTQCCWLDDFYMRDHKDLIYIYCLDNNMDYEQAKELINEYSYLDNLNPDPNETNQNLSSERVTTFLAKEMKVISTVNELRAFIEHNQEYFGTFRRQAYETFMEYYNTEKYSHPADAPTDEEICKDITMNITSLRGKQKGKHDILYDVMKKIAEDALSRTTLSEITSKKIAVKRKHLILLWLYVNAGSPDFNDNELKNKDIAFRGCITNINDSLLEPCGMPWLDSRNPFDWVVMHALHYAYFSGNVEDDDAVERINKVMTIIFNGSVK